MNSFNKISFDNKDFLKVRNSINSFKITLCLNIVNHNIFELINSRYIYAQFLVVDLKMQYWWNYEIKCNTNETAKMMFVDKVISRVEKKFCYTYSNEFHICVTIHNGKNLK